MPGESYKIFPLRAQPGIKKDGTQTEGDYWNNGQWVRFYRGLPRSMLGYRSMTQAFPGPSRGLFVDSGDVSGFFNIFSGSADEINVGQFSTSGFGSGINNITPSGFVADPANVWQMGSFYNANGSGSSDLIAHAAPNLADISSAVNTRVYYGDITAITPLVGCVDDSSNPFKVSGGVCAIGPYAVAYGNFGQINWSNLNDPTTFPVANAANPVATKFVKGMSVRGNSAPAGVFWSIDSLVLMSFVGGDVVWTFETISDQSSVLSSSAMVEKDGVYYWPGIDRFLTYNTVLQELPNELSLDFFYTNLNYAQRQKVFGYKVPRWGEIVWCAPLFGATECNWMFVYNVRENSWYDTPLPADGRTAAYFAQSWQYPVLSGASTYNGGINLWQSEFGTNEIIGKQVNAIESFIESPSASIVGGGLTFTGSPEFTPDSVFTQLVGFEQDFDFGASLNIDLLTRQFAQDTDTLAQANAIAQGDNYFDSQIQARYMRWRITSNCQNGGFIMGVPMVRYRTGDRNP